MTTKPKRFLKLTGDEEDIFQTPPFAITANSETRTHYTVYVDKQINATEQFIPAIEVLRNASEEDTVTIILNTPGGSLAATDSFLHAMRGCRGEITVQGSGYVASAGTLILLEADNVELTNDVIIMFHSASFGAYGQHEQAVKQMQYFDKHLKQFTEKSYKYFLTDDELNSLLHHNAEIYMGAEEFIERMKNQRKKWVELQEEEMNEQSLETEQEEA